MAQVVIASRLSDGLVVFLDEAKAKGSVVWVLRLEGADVAATDERAAELLDLKPTTLHEMMKRLGVTAEV